MTKKKIFTLFSILVILDAITKYVVVSRLTQFDTIVVIPHFFNIVLVRNRGIAFGLFSGIGKFYKNIVLILIALFVVYFLFGFLRETGNKVLYFSVTMIIAGIVGNIIDRLINGSVIDFIDLYIKRFHWPSFNLADIYITVGIVIILIFLIRDWKSANA